MTHEQKQQARNALVRYLGSFNTQAQAAENLEGISPTLISQVKNYHWEMISDAMWYKIARQVGFYDGWKPADTGAYMLLRILFTDAQHYNMAYGIAIGSGLGKTFTAKQYSYEQNNAWYIACNELHNRKSFVQAMLKTMNVEAKGTVPEMVQQLVNVLDAQDEPVLILDDAHLLKARVLQFVITLHTALTGRCGFVIMGNDELRKRVVEGVEQSKEGYEQIYKSIGRRFITLGRLGPNDVALVCKANGLTDEALVAHVKEQCGDNLHSIEQYIEHYRLSKAA